MGFKFRKLSRDECRQLLQKRISTDDGIWHAIGTDFDDGVEKLARETFIRRDHLVEHLVGSSLREAAPGRSRWLQWASRHTLDLLALCVFLLLTVLCLRAGGWLSWLPPPWGLTQKIPVAGTDLRKGQVLRSGDLVEVWLNPRREQFRNPADVEGFRLLKDLSAGSPIRFTDVLRSRWSRSKTCPAAAG